MASLVCRNVGQGLRLRGRGSALLGTPVRNHTGYIAFEGRIGAGENEWLRFIAQTKKINLQPVKRIHFSFDPFRPEVGSVRQLMQTFSGQKVRATNIKCAYKFDVLSDFSEPLMKVELSNDEAILFKTANLTPNAVLTEFNRIVLPLVKEETPQVLATKGAAKMGSSSEAAKSAKKKR